MVKLTASFLLMLLTSMYCFPFQFTFLRGFNTKMMVALAGLIIYIVNLSRHGSEGLSKNMTQLSIIALVVSVWAIFAVTINDTPETEYCDYIVSMWVWIGGAYCVVQAIRAVHGQASVILIAGYFAAVGVFQCVAALVFDNYPGITAFVERFIGLGSEGMAHIKRLYGIGAQLDPAGARFSGILVAMVAAMAHMKRTRFASWIWLWTLAWIFIAVVGNIIARTTTVGVILSVVYVIVHLIISRRPVGQPRSFTAIRQVGIALFAGIAVAVAAYNASPKAEKLMRFGFEGFFSLVEEGEWDVASNNTLANMIVFPETRHTWLIGDGYMSNPALVDPHYTGPVYEGFYKNTDIGYLRFIFLFGTIGLALFTFFFVRLTQICIRITPQYRLMFIILLLTLLTIWLKVSTDILVIFAPFLILNPGEDKEYDLRIARTRSDEIILES